MRELVLVSDQTAAATARRFASESLVGEGLSEGETFDILLALNEAVANACRHAYPTFKGEITIRCGREGDEFVLTVSDDGKGFDFSAEMFEMPEPMSPRGRGFFLMRELMDKVEIHTDGFGTMVTLRRDCNAHASADNHD